MYDFYPSRERLPSRGCLASSCRAGAQGLRGVEGDLFPSVLFVCITH